MYVYVHAYMVLCIDVHYTHAFINIMCIYNTWSSISCDPTLSWPSWTLKLADRAHSFSRSHATELALEPSCVSMLFLADSCSSRSRTCEEPGLEGKFASKSREFNQPVC